MDNSKKACIYLRLSREKGEDEDSLSNHRTTLMGIAESQGYSYVIYSDGIASSMDSDREQYNIMLKDIKAGEYDAVFAHDIDRLSRSGATLMALAETLEMHCPIFITPTAEYDLREDNNKLLFSFGSVIADAEYRQIRKRLLVGKLNSARAGKWQGNPTPYGYIRDSEGRLTPDEEESKVYRYAVDLMLQGMSYPSACKKLNAEGYRTRDHRLFRMNSVSRMINNPVYRGILNYKNAQGSVEVKDAHEPLIKVSEYQLISDLVQQRTKSYNRTRSTTSFITSGLFICTKCSNRMLVNSTANPKYKNYKETGEYRVANILKKCTNKSCKNYGHSLEKLEKAILEEIKKYSVEVEKELSKIKTHDNTTIVKKYHDKIKDAEKSLAKLEDKKENLLSLAVDGLIDKNTFKERQQGIEEEKDHLKDVVESYKESLINLDTSTYEQRIKYLVDNIKNIRTSKQIKEDADLTDKDKKELVTNINNFLKSIISKVEYQKDEQGQKVKPTLTITWAE
ncbi:recombinase family protein [Salinicoccus carnicancri]|uniref:recombinase family protein n=1 Tax=Salinicoccus carnicancri TaxID=558170 RepID=UPI0002F801B1|nr:recombinase family protein [Salinicoccus carnicancri]